MRKILLILLFVSGFTCSEVAPIYLSEETVDREIVLNCFFEPNAIFAASLSETRFRPTRSTYDTTFALSDAEVRLYEDDMLIGKLVENDTLYPYGIEYSRRGIYTLDYYPVPGKTYRIEAAKEGYDPVWAESQIPPVRGNVKTLDVSKTNAFEPDHSHLYHYFDMSVFLEDPPGNDYYHLDIYHELWWINFLTGDTIEHNFREEFFKTVDQEFIIQISGPSGRDELIFNDLLFDGTGLQIDFRELGRAQHATYAMSKDEDLSNLDDDYYVKYYAYLMNISFEYYEYFRTGKQQLKTIEDPFAEPVRVYSNIHNGKGVFAGYNKQIFPIPAGFLYYEGDWN